jgi:hypothetical protein
MWLLPAAAMILVAEWFKAPVLKLVFGHPRPYPAVMNGPEKQALPAYNKSAHTIPFCAVPSSSLANG